MNVSFIESPLGDYQHCFTKAGNVQIKFYVHETIYG